MNKDDVAFEGQEFEKTRLRNQVEQLKRALLAMWQDQASAREQAEEALRAAGISDRTLRPDQYCRACRKEFRQPARCPTRRVCRACWYEGAR